MELSALHTCSPADLPAVSSEEKNHTVNKSENESPISPQGREGLNLTCAVIFWIHMNSKLPRSSDGRVDNLPLSGAPIQQSSSSRLQMQQMRSEKRRKSQPSVRIFIQTPNPFTFEGPGCRPLEGRVNTGYASLSNRRYGTLSAIHFTALFLIEWSDSFGWPFSLLSLLSNFQ